MAARTKKKHVDVVVRRAKSKADAAAAGAFGAALARAHHAWDPGRFFVVPDLEDGYAWWLGKELKNQDAVVLVAEVGGVIVGYAYGLIEPRDWNALREKCGVAVDLYVDEKHRKSGVGDALVEALTAELKAMGAPFVVLQVAANNKNAQRFFSGRGFRPTMIEMTKPV